MALQLATFLEKARHWAPGPQRVYLLGSTDMRVLIFGTEEHP
jgi:hypothetical protein